MDATDMTERTIFALTGVKLHLTRQNIAPPPTIENRHPEPRYTYGLTFSNSPTVRDKWEKFSKGNFYSELFQIVDEYCRWYRNIYLAKQKSS